MDSGFRFAVADIHKVVAVFFCVCSYNEKGEEELSRLIHLREILKPCRCTLIMKNCRTNMGKGQKKENNK